MWTPRSGCNCGQVEKIMPLLPFILVRFVTYDGNHGWGVVGFVVLYLLFCNISFHMAQLSGRGRDGMTGFTSRGLSICLWKLDHGRTYRRRLYVTHYEYHECSNDYIIICLCT